MRGFLASTAVLGVIAVGGVPALGLVMTGEETAPSDQRTATDKDEREGPPPWARGRGGSKGADEKGRGADERSEDQGPPAWARGGAGGKQRGVPPGWARNHGGAAPHGWAVREWAHCMAGAAQEREPGQRLDRTAACGEKPMSPGHVKQGQSAKPDKPQQPKAGRSG